MLIAFILSRTSPYLLSLVPFVHSVTPLQNCVHTMNSPNLKNYQKMIKTKRIRRKNSLNIDKLSIWSYLRMVFVIDYLAAAQSLSLYSLTERAAPFVKRYMISSRTHLDLNWNKKQNRTNSKSVNIEISFSHQLNKQALSDSEVFFGNKLNRK